MYSPVILYTALPNLLMIVRLSLKASCEHPDPPLTKILIHLESS